MFWQKTFAERNVTVKDELRLALTTAAALDPTAKLALAGDSQDSLAKALADSFEMSLDESDSSVRIQDSQIPDPQTTSQKDSASAQPLPIASTSALPLEDAPRRQSPRTLTRSSSKRAASASFITPERKRRANTDNARTNSDGNEARSRAVFECVEIEHSANTPRLPRSRSPKKPKTANGLKRSLSEGDVLTSAYSSTAYNVQRPLMLRTATGPPSGNAGASQSLVVHSDLDQREDVTKLKAAFANCDPKRTFYDFEHLC